MTDTIEELKNSFFAKEIIRRLYQKTRDVAFIAEETSKLLDKRSPGRFISEPMVKKFIAQITEDALSDERETNKIVNSMLKSIGQDLDGNIELKEKKEKELFDKNSPQNTLKYCQVCVDKEVERGVVSA